MELRSEILARILPKTRIADRRTIDKGALIIKGQLGTYRIELAAGTAMVESESLRRGLKIPQKILDSVELNLNHCPIDLDYRTKDHPAQGAHPRRRLEDRFARAGHAAHV